MKPKFNPAVWRFVAQDYFGHGEQAVREAQALLFELAPPPHLSDFYVAASKVADPVVMKNLWHEVERRTHAVICGDLFRHTLAGVAMSRKALFDSPSRDEWLAEFVHEFPARLTATKVAKMGHADGVDMYIDNLVNFAEAFTADESNANKHEDFDDDAAADMVRVFDAQTAPPDIFFKILLDTDVITGAAMGSTCNIALEVLQGLYKGEKAAAIAQGFRQWGAHLTQENFEPFRVSRLPYYLSLPQPKA